MNKNLNVNKKNISKMHCCECNREVQEKELIGEKCFKCVYREKNKVSISYRKCKRCKEYLPKSRWRFCSNKCLVKFSRENSVKHWTQSIKNSNCDRNWKDNKFRLNRVSNPTESTDY